MKKALFFILIVCFFTAVSYGQELLDDEWEKAYIAWDTGDYITALQGFKKILSGPKSGLFLERIALTTGELYHVTEVAPDGTSLAFSPSGRYASFQITSGLETVINIIDVQNGMNKIAEIRGTNVVFSPVDDRVAFIRVKVTSEVKNARKELEKITREQRENRQARNAQQQELRWIEALNSEIIIRDLQSGREETLSDGGMLKASPVFSADGSDVYFVGGTQEDNSLSDIFVASASGGSPRKLTSGPGFKTNPVAVSGGRILLYSLSSRNPLPQPPGGQPASGRRGRGGRGFSSREFETLNLQTGQKTTYSGSPPSVSAGGSALVYTAGTDEGSEITVVDLTAGNDPVIVKKTTERIGSPVISPDGLHVAFDMMDRRNWEIFVVNSDGAGEEILSREIQHDRRPQFITSDKVLAVKGEGRHQRSYIYDLRSKKSIKLFHNNTIRTIAPEYAWIANREGTKILIQSERDGDTITPEREIYLVDLTRKVTKQEVLERIETNLSNERALRLKGEKMFRPIFDDVKAVTEKVSITKIFEYQKALFDFDSKNITRPGNKPAGDYIYNAFKSFGYQPEYQWFEQRGTRTANILATLRGTKNPELVYVISSHYDSNSRGPGADDNTSCIAILLETARLMANKPMPATIVFAAFTGEESGLLGSTYYVAQAVQNNINLVCALNNDMVGWSEDHRLDNTIRYSNLGIRDVQHAAAFLFSKMVTYDAHYYKSTDAAAYYREYGDIVGGLGSYPVLGNPYYHQPTDLLETINHELVTEAAKFNIASIMLLASSPSRINDFKAEKGKDNTIDLSWKPSPEKGLSHYIIAFGPESNPMEITMSVTEPRAVLPVLYMKEGITIHFAVKAVTEPGFEGWDWAHTSIEGKDKEK